MSRTIVNVLGPNSQPFEIPIQSTKRFYELLSRCNTFKWGSNEYFNALDKFDDEFQCYEMGWAIVHKSAEANLQCSK